MSNFQTQCRKKNKRTGLGREGGREEENKRKGKKKWYHNWTTVFKNSPSYPAVHLTLAVSNKKG